METKADGDENVHKVRSYTLCLPSFKMLHKQHALLVSTPGASRSTLHLHRSPPCRASAEGDVIGTVMLRVAQGQRRALCCRALSATPPPFLAYALGLFLAYALRLFLAYALRLFLAYAHRRAARLCRAHGRKREEDA